LRTVDLNENKLIDLETRIKSTIGEITTKREAFRNRLLMNKTVIFDEVYYPNSFGYLRVLDGRNTRRLIFSIEDDRLMFLYRNFYGNKSNRLGNFYFSTWKLF
jgi:hypothetical protein